MVESQARTVLDRFLLLPGASSSRVPRRSRSVDPRYLRKEERSLRFLIDDHRVDDPSVEGR
ncbi:MAG: hypothetical protein D6795_19475 [Deltaproteobacteria bacterium]|nr:MAG: hypothetical protein D6795_19475 [Deltaproteobacteria bacterium]